jgi:hypothetical protein
MSIVANRNLSLRLLDLDPQTLSQNPGEKSSSNFPDYPPPSNLIKEHSIKLMLIFFSPEDDEGAEKRVNKSIHLYQVVSLSFQCF